MPGKNPNPIIIPEDPNDELVITSYTVHDSKPNKAELKVMFYTNAVHKDLKLDLPPAVVP